jgi:hypothetical protein
MFSWRRMGEIAMLGTAGMNPAYWQSDLHETETAFGRLVV